MLSMPKRSSAPPSTDRTCTLRTRFSQYGDLERAVAVLVQEDGRLFVPLAPGQVTTGESLKVAFTTLSGAATVNRLAVVESITPDRSISNGEPGVVLRLLDWKSPPIPAAVDSDEGSFLGDPRNPLAGVDTNMVALLVECTLTESQQEIGHTYDDIPCVQFPNAPGEEPDDAEPTRRVATARPVSSLAIQWDGGADLAESFAARPLEVVRPLEIVRPFEGDESLDTGESLDGEPLEAADLDDADLEDLVPASRWRPTAGVIIGGALGLGLALALVMGPRLVRPFLGRPVPALIKGLSDSNAATDGHAPLPPVLLLAGRGVPAMIPPAQVEEAAEDPAAPSEAAPAHPATCQVKLLSQPSRVEVWSGDRRIGRTPISRLSIPCGTALTLTRTRYQTASLQVPAQPGGTPTELSVRLLRPTARLDVTSAPSGAEVRIRGQIVGHTPATLTVSRYDSMVLEVRAPNLAPWKKRLYIRKPEMAVQADVTSRSSRHRGSSPESSDLDGQASLPPAERR
jgi:hypothetical protein